MPNTESNFNPAYSTVKAIFLSPILPNDISETNNRLLKITGQNSQCRFERLELVENVNDVLPSGAIMVKDTNDIETFIAANKIKYVIIQFFDGSRWNGEITSVSYMNNAASDTEETLVVINFTNLYYTYFSSRGVIDLLGYKKPQIFSINEFVTFLRTVTFGASEEANGGYQDKAVNYFLYRPFVPYNSGDESVPDNAIELLNYISTYAINNEKNPYFLFWTGFGGEVNFKYFHRDLTKDLSYATIDQEFRNIGIFDGDAVLQKLSDQKIYRKSYFLATNPAFQWISKNYYYIRKTPKYVDEIFSIAGVCGGELSEEQLLELNNIKTKNLAFHFLDDGQKYNLNVVTVQGRAKSAPPGGDQIYPDTEWGYYDGQIPSNNRSITNLLGSQYGTEQQYSLLNMMGISGMMPYLDSPDMWRNMFSITPIHPNYPTQSTVSTDEAVSGSETNLQKVLNIRYDSFLSNNGLSGACGGQIGFASTNHLELMRQIEAQNFVMYSLCCMGAKEDCFFALLQKYEPDSSYPNGVPPGATFEGGAKFYRYKWNKIIFEGASTSGLCGACGAAGACGSAGACGGSGGTTYAHQLEAWFLDPSMKSSAQQDNTWAINLNERGLTANYLPPGWVSTNLPDSFKFRPIGTKSNISPPPSTGEINHIVRLCINQSSPADRVIYFWAENIVDGAC